LYSGVVSGSWVTAGAAVSVGSGADVVTGVDVIIGSASGVVLEDGAAVGSDVETSGGFTAGSGVAVGVWDVVSISLQPAREIAGIKIEAIITAKNKV